MTTDPLGILSRIIDKNEVQLEQFMALAEDVSNKIETLTTTRKRLMMYVGALIILSGLAIGIFIFGNQIEVFKDYKMYLVFIYVFVSFCLFNAVKLLITANKIEQGIERESYMLGELLNITDSYKEKLIDQSDAVRKMYFDMRMSRIDFSHAKFKKQPPSIQQKPVPTKPAKSPISTPT